MTWFRLLAVFNVPARTLNGSQCMFRQHRDTSERARLHPRKYAAAR